MEAIVERIVEKCIQSELIEESQRDWMAYSLQRKFMNFGGFFILVCFGALVAPLPQVILLNFGLAFLREKTNGLHMPTVFSCFLTSLFCEYACLYLIDRLQSSTIAATIMLLIVSVRLSAPGRSRGTFQGAAALFHTGASHRYGAAEYRNAAR